MPWFMDVGYTELGGGWRAEGLSFLAPSPGSSAPKLQSYSRLAPHLLCPLSPLDLGLHDTAHRQTQPS